jgi:uncharacterized protein
MDVTFDSDGFVLAGTLTEVRAPVAAALVVTGSGRLNRDSDARLRRPPVTLLRTGVTRQVAEALTAANVLTLRYDKRGIGASGGDYRRSGMTDNLADARAGLQWLAARAPGLPLLTVGHSEGTCHAARLAAEEEVAGTILLSAMARTGEQILDFQIEKIAPTLPRAAKAIMRITGSDFARTQHKRIERLKATSGDVTWMSGIRVNARWYREFFAWDPTPDFARIAVPVLAITGGHDMQVPPEDAETIIGRLVQGPFEGHVVDDLSHLLRPDPDWAGPRGYRRAVRQPVSPAVLAMITRWVAGHWAQPPGGQPGTTGRQGQEPAGV